MAVDERIQYISFVRILTVAFLTLTGCQGETYYETTSDPVYELISINTAEFIKNRGIELDYSIVNSEENAICLPNDIIKKESSALGIVEVKNSLGTKAQLTTHGLRLFTQGSAELFHNETLNLSIKQWAVPLWYPRWMPTQEARISIRAKFCGDIESTEEGKLITLNSPWTKVK